MRDELRKHERDYIGELVRLDIPLRSVVNLRRVASELRGLAEALDRLSRDPGDAADVLWDARKAARRAQSNMRKIKSPGRPKKRTETLRWIRKTETQDLVDD